MINDKLLLKFADWVGIYIFDGKISRYEKIPVLDNIWFARENRNPL